MRVGGKRKRSRINCSFGCKYLLCVVDNACFADNVNLDLAWVGKLCFDLLGHFTSEEHHIVIADRFRLNNDTYFTTCLECEGLFYAVKA